MEKKQARALLKVYIKEHAAAKVELNHKRREYKASTYEDRQTHERYEGLAHIDSDRMCIGYRARLALLAYGMIKGIPYLAMEAKTNHVVYPYEIARVIEKVLDIKGTNDMVGTWMKGGKFEFQWDEPASSEAVVS